MKHKIKGGIQAALVIIASGIKLVNTPAAVQWFAVAIAGAGAYVVAVWELKPDRRVEKIRRYALDALLKNVFADARAKVAPGQRMPFRVNIMVPSRTFVRRYLHMVYTYEMPRNDPDYGISFGMHSGLSSEVYRTRNVGIFDRRRAGPTRYKLSRDQRSRCEHIVAIISFPIRSQHAEGAPDAAVTAVLNIDAITDGAADELNAIFAEIKQSRTHNFLDVADYCGLFF